MAKTKRTPAEEMQGDGDASRTTEAGATPAVAASEPAQEHEPRPPIVTPDPRGVMSVSLGNAKGSPRMQLSRSHKYKQMQMSFDQQPDEKYLAMLREAGWTDRTETEGVWTKQVGQGQWQPVADAERLFKDIANSIRKDKGLEPVLQGLSAA